MLTRIEISNFLTIEKISFNLDSNIIAVVGESGAGKSLILKAIESVFSQKTITSIVGKFSNESLVKIFFTLNPEQMEALSQFGIYEEYIVIKKIIKPKKTRAFINHEPVSSKVLSEIKSILFTIVSQNYRFRFFESKNILEVIDSLIDKKIKSEFEQSYYDFLEIKDKKRGLEKEINHINEKHPEILLESIEKVDPKQNEYENLIEKLKKIKSLSFAKEKSFEIISKLYEDNNSVETTIIEIEKIFEKMHDMGFNTVKVMEAINGIAESLSDIKSTVYDMQNNIHEENIDDVESRLFELEQLQRKFNTPINNIIKKKEELRKMIVKKDEIVFELQKIDEKLKEKGIDLSEKAEKLSKARKIAAKIMENKIYEFLKDMLLKNSVVKLDFCDKTIDENGKDCVNILFSANPDIKADKIEKIASGGERSRFILAMEAASSQIKQHSETIILDEIESGISDETLKKTADVIKKLSNINQIILITHNQHLSSMVDKLFKIEKTFDGNLTRSFIKQIV